FEAPQSGQRAAPATSPQLVGRRSSVTVAVLADPWPPGRHDRLIRSPGWCLAITACRSAALSMLVPSALVITSPARRPASAAGEPGSTAPTSAPVPPVSESCTPRKAGGRAEEPPATFRPARRSGRALTTVSLRISHPPFSGPG